MPTAATGQIIPHGEGWTARIRVAPNDCRLFRLALSMDDEVAQCNALCAHLALRL